MIRRFVIVAALATIAASIIWWVSAETVSHGTVAGAKLLHAVMGYPAPFLQADVKFLYWHAPLFPPFFGLMLASSWLPMRRRMIGFAIGLAAFWYVVSLQVAMTYSPYLTLSPIRSYVLKSMISLNQVAVPVLLWLITAGIPHLAFRSTGTTTRPSKTNQKSAGGITGASSPHRLIKPMTSVALAGLFCLLCTLLAWPVIRESNATLDAARRRVANAIRAGDDRSALKGIEDMFAIQGNNSQLSYLQERLRQRLMLQANR